MLGVAIAASTRSGFSPGPPTVAVDRIHAPTSAIVRFSVR